VSSKRNLRRRMCGGKRGYSSPAAAYAALRGHQHNIGEGVHIYECAFCGSLHLGHPRTPKRTRQNFKQLT
jgi:hypothetical protein